MTLTAASYIYDDSVVLHFWKSFHFWQFYCSARKLHCSSCELCEPRDQSTDNVALTVAGIQTFFFL